MKTKKDKIMEKGVHELLNDLITSKFSHNNFIEDMKKMNVKSTNFVSYFTENVDQFSDSFSISIFKELMEKVYLLNKSKHVNSY